MRTIISIIAAIALAFTCASVDFSELAENCTIVSFEANATTGYAWTSFVLGGESAVVDEGNSSYVADDNPNNLNGVGGTQYFTVKAIEPGETIIRFTYARNPGDIAKEVIMLFTVDEELNVYSTDVTEMGVYDGTVISVDTEDNSVMLLTGRMGEVIARFYDGEMLPAEGEHIMLYTNGTMTMSLPPIVNVIAWSSIPDGMARG